MPLRLTTNIRAFIGGWNQESSAREVEGAWEPNATDTWSARTSPKNATFMLADEDFLRANIGVNPVTTKPWQIVALATLCFIQAAHLLTEILEDLMVSANPASVAAWAEMGFRASDSGPDVASIYDYLANSQVIFTIMAVVIFMFGFLLYRGEYLPAVRLTGTIFFAVGALGQLFSPATADGTPLHSELADYMSTGLSALLLLGFLSLFAGKSAQWVKAHPDS